MLRGNLATRPFYNERLVSLIMGFVAVIVLALTVSNVTRLIALSSRRSELRAQIGADEATAARIRQTAAEVQRGVDRKELVGLVGSAKEANALIDERTFSWTTLLTYLESTIPMGVRLTSVTPEFKKGDIIITMMLVGRRFEDVAEFIDALEGTGAFYDAAPTVTELTEEGLERATVRALYLPPPPVKGAAPGTGGGQ